MCNFETININLSCQDRNGEIFVIVEGIAPMSLKDFAYWLKSACRDDRNIEKRSLVGAPEPRRATRESVPVTYDTKEKPMPKERKTYEQRITAQITKLRRKHPNASTEQLRKAAEEIEKSISEALSGLDFSDLFAPAQEPVEGEAEENASTSDAIRVGIF